MTVKLVRKKLSELSRIRHEGYLGKSKSGEYREIMVIKFIGEYASGSMGDSDAQFMYAVGESAVAGWEPEGIVIDCSRLKYEWGDMLDSVWGIGRHHFAKGQFPCAVIVGPDCAEAIRTLELGERSEETIESIDGFFRDFDSAWGYVEKKLAQLDREYREAMDRAKKPDR